MAAVHVVILGAGLGGTIAAYEIHHALKGKARVTVINKGTDYWFVPSNPWVAVGWREPEEIRVKLPPIMEKLGIEFIGTGARKVDPENNRIELNDGATVEYDYLIVATGPELAFDEIEGFGPDRNTVSICETSHAVKARAKFEELCANPRPIVVGAAQGASCYGPAYEMAMLLDTELRRRQVRDKIPMTFVTPEPYIGHLGLDGVGDTKGLLESEMRNRHIKWITNAKVASVEAATIHIEEVGEDAKPKKTHDLDFGWCMLMPPFRGIEALMGLDGLVNPRGFVLVDDHQRNPKYRNVFAIGVCIAIPPTGPTPLPVGVPKTGFMIESMVTAVTENLRELLEGKEPTHEATWNAICLADFGDGGVAFIAKPQIPPRNTNWSSEGRWVHLAKIGFEKYFLRKIRKGETEPFYEKLALHMLGVKKLRFDKENA
ncbi:NAD(P)/FAD-dependent oxidoreductase [Croceibacterium aestuarii]|uniref:NAD(P)/FAD-dependent oxidoreductase n=1 Tax=Croceibacterium aestuarii TaxID=3064139 RepID=UPI00272DCBE0|nr:FAD-dependent oxidoreductase [Croceibacterium sp. D39]